MAETGVALDGTTYTSVYLDFGPGSVDGWLAGLVADELGLESRLALDETAREVVVEGSRIVHSLREKLGAHGDAVETVRGVGYRLREGWTTEPA